MQPTLPYRELAPTTPTTYELSWRDAEDRPNPMRAYAAVVVGSGLAVALTTASWVLGLLAFVSAVAYAVWESRRRKPAVVRLEFVDGVLSVVRPGGTAARVSLAALRNVEIDRKSIRRVTYAQDVGAPLPETRLSADVDIARIALVLDGGATARLTESYASYSECIEQFGKVRVFLRKLGWLPEDERAPR